MAFGFRLDFLSCSPLFIHVSNQQRDLVAYELRPTSNTKKGYALSIWGGEMIRIPLVAACTVALGIWQPNAQAQATTDKEAVKEILVNDAQNYIGDRIRFAVQVIAIRKSDSSNKVCIPPLTRMSVLGKADDGTHLIVKITDGAKDCDSKEIKTTEAYLISTKDLTESGLARTGSTFGALVVPFKWHLQGNRDVSASSTLGAYLGYRFETANRIGYTLTPIGFMGASNISVPTTSDGEAKDQNLFGFSWGVGLIGTFKGSFQAGVVLGWDHVSKSAGYQYNGKPWLAFEIGFNFLQ